MFHQLLREVLKTAVFGYRQNMTTERMHDASSTDITEQQFVRLVCSQHWQRWQDSGVCMSMKSVVQLPIGVHDFKPACHQSLQVAS